MDQIVEVEVEEHKNAGNPLHYMTRCQKCRFYFCAVICYPCVKISECFHK